MLLVEGVRGGGFGLQMSQNKELQVAEAHIYVLNIWVLC